MLYTRSIYKIREYMKTAEDQNKHREGPSNKAIKQAHDFVEKLVQYEEEEKAKQEKELEQLDRDKEDFILAEALDPARTGVAKSGFVRSNPVECTQRRLFAKVLLRRARAYELMGNLDAGVDDLRVVNRVEPENREARQRLRALEAQVRAAREPLPEMPPSPASPSSGSPIASCDGPGDEAGGNAIAAMVQAKPAERADVPSGTAEANAKKGKRPETDDLEEDEEEVFDHSATAQLLQSAAEYMKRNDYQGALQIYGYLRRKCREWDSPLTELKVLSNTSLCLQRLRGRLPELVKACTEALDRIADLRRHPSADVPEDMLLNMECAVLSRRGNAYSQQQKTEESNRDAALVRQLLGKPA